MKGRIVITHITETLVLGAMITTFIFMSKQPHIDEAKRDRDALEDGNEGIDRLNSILDEDTMSVGTDTIVEDPKPH